MLTFQIFHLKVLILETADQLQPPNTKQHEGDTKG
jgi:hypothetical protein